MVNKQFKCLDKLCTVLLKVKKQKIADIIFNNAPKSKHVTKFHLLPKLLFKFQILFLTVILKYKYESLYNLLRQFMIEIGVEVTINEER